MKRILSIALLPILALPVLGIQDTVTIRSRQVVPATMQDSLSVRRNREGDRFSLRADMNRDIPSGTYFEGKVQKIVFRDRRDRDDRYRDYDDRNYRDRDYRDRDYSRPAYMEVVIDRMILPDGHQIKIKAYPVAWNERSFSRDRDGRIMTKRPAKKGDSVFGGLVGGLLFGSLIDKPFEGAFVGTLVGILAAETGEKGDTVLRRDERVGIAFEKDVKFEYDGRWDRRDRDDRYDRYDNRDDRYNDRNDRSGDDRDLYDRPSSRRAEARIEVGNDRLEFRSEELPYGSGRNTMVALRTASKQLDIEVRERNNDEFRLSDRNISVDIVVGERDVRANGRTIRLTRNIERRNDVVYVPIDLFAYISRDEIRVDGTKIARPD